MDVIWKDELDGVTQLGELHPHHAPGGHRETVDIALLECTIADAESRDDVWIPSGDEIAGHADAGLPSGS